MKLSRAWRLDIAAGLLLVAGLLVAIAVLSRDPMDDPGRVYPAPEEVRNLLGPPGAWLAAEFVGALGAGVYLWLGAWVVFVLLLVVRRDVIAWACRLVGVLLLVPVGCVLAQRHLEPRADSPFAGVGGAVGGWLDAWLVEQFPETGILLVAAFAALGVGLAGWFVWRRLFLGLRWMAAELGRRVPGGARLLRRVLGRIRLPRRVKADLVLPIVRPEIPVDGRAPVPEVKPARSLGSFFSKLTIPILHHETKALDIKLDPDEPHLEERVGSPKLTLSNGMHSERERFAGYEVPPLHLLEDTPPVVPGAQDQQLRDRAALLEKTFADFGITVKVVGINTGPVVTMYEITLETGLRVAKVVSLADDIALNLKVPSVRMVAPLPGKNAVGIEIPNETRADVFLKEVIQLSASRIARAKIPLFLGKDAEGRPLMYDLADMPHLLIAGTTGTGKSVCLTTIILSLLMTRRPDEVRMVLIDPKSGVEMQWCSRVPHLMSPIIEDMKKAEAVLAWAVDKMEERYDLLRRARVRNVAGYNDLSAEEILRRVKPIDDEERKRIPERMPYIVIVIDEMSDLMMQFKKEVEGYIIRLAQKSRAAGIHLVLATQKPTVDVITGLIKSNLPSRLCFKVAQKSDSRVVLDQMGADKLLGRGDMLFLPPGTSDLTRAQGAYAGDAEITRVADYLESEPCYETELLQLKTKEMREADESGGSLVERVKSRDKLYEQAIDVVVREGRGSVSLLQRALGIGYGRAARLIDFMAEDGIVGTYNGSNARDVMFSPEEWAAARAGQEAS
jgi:DNA segregation ATPase FtsK/SpoIIIE, S-DNA-T family